MSSAPNIQQWSTALVEPDKRLDYWIAAVCEGFLEMNVTSVASTGFWSSLQRAQLGVIGVNRVEGDAQRVYRTKSAISRGRSNFYYILCKTDRNWSATQAGTTAMIRPFDLFLVDSRRPYEFRFPVTSETISLELPTGWVDSWLAAPDRHLGRVIDGHSGWGLALSSFVRQWSPELAVRSPLPAPLLVDQLGALLALALEDGTTSKAELSRTPNLIDRIRHALRERYAEPGLTASVIASQLQISERTLHRALASASVTFSGLLVDCRMSAARRLLSEPRFDRVSIGGIGQKVGLSDPSHFIRQCRKHFGVTPGVFRRQR